jgi:hypothetical protein
VAALPAGVPPAGAVLPLAEPEVPACEPAAPAGGVPEADGPDPGAPCAREPSAPLDGEPPGWLPLVVWPDCGPGIGIVAGLPEDGLLWVGNEDDWPPGEELGEGMLEGDPPPLGEGIPEAPPPPGGGGEGMAVPPEDGWVGVEDDGQPASSSEAAARAALVPQRREFRSAFAMVGTP